MVYSTLLRDTYSASCSSTCSFRYLWCPLNTYLVGWWQICVYGRICLLFGNQNLIPHLVVVYFIHCLSPSLYWKNNLQYCFH